MDSLTWDKWYNCAPGVSLSIQLGWASDRACSHNKGWGAKKKHEGTNLFSDLCLHHKCWHYISQNKSCGLKDTLVADGRSLKVILHTEDKEFGSLIQTISHKFQGTGQPLSPFMELSATDTSRLQGLWLILLWMTHSAKTEDIHTKYRQIHMYVHVCMYMHITKISNSLERGTKINM